MSYIIKGMRAVRLSSPLYFTCCRSFYFFHGEIGFGLPVFGQHFLADLFHHSRFAFCVLCRKGYELQANHLAKLLVVTLHNAVGHGQMLMKCALNFFYLYFYTTANQHVV